MSLVYTKPLECICSCLMAMLLRNNMEITFLSLSLREVSCNHTNSSTYNSIRYIITDAFGSLKNFRSIIVPINTNLTFIFADPCKTDGCDAPYNTGCRVVDNAAECICPTCLDTLSPVCTSDDVQDRSECLMKRQSCVSGDLVTVAKSGPCGMYN